jgi:prepilin-type N-terminal cleavage/methylation domain-containing protein
MYRTGFTLIELMIIVAIIGILAAILIPFWQGKEARAEVSEGMMFAAQIKALTSEHYINQNVWPANLEALGIVDSPTGEYVSNITMNNGTITLTFGMKAHTSISGNKLSLKPLVNDTSGEVVWVCGRASNPDGAGEAFTGPSGENSTSASFFEGNLPKNCY